VQVDPINLKLKPPGTKCLKLKCDVLLSTSAFKSNLRPYTEDCSPESNTKMPWKCRKCGCVWAGAYTRPPLSSTLAASDTETRPIREGSLNNVPCQVRTTVVPERARYKAIFSYFGRFSSILGDFGVCTLPKHTWFAGSEVGTERYLQSALVRPAHPSLTPQPPLRAFPIP